MPSNGASRASANMIQTASAQQQLKEQKRKHSSSPVMNSSLQGPASTVTSTSTSMHNPISAEKIETRANSKSSPFQMEDMDPYLYQPTNRNMNHQKPQGLPPKPYLAQHDGSLPIPIGSNRQARPYQHHMPRTSTRPPTTASYQQGPVPTPAPLNNHGTRMGMVTASGPQNKVKTSSRWTRHEVSDTCLVDFIGDVVQTSDFMNNFSQRTKH